MASTTNNLPVSGSGDRDGGKAPYAYVPGTGAAPLRGGTANTVSDGTTGNVVLTQQLVEQGGVSYVSITAASAGVVKAAAGRLVKVIVIALGTAAVSIYDNSTAASGTVIFTVPASAATGTIYPVDIPTISGIYVGGGANSPALLCTIY